MSDTDFTRPDLGRLRAMAEPCWAGGAWLVTGHPDQYQEAGR
jgi:hypothetical protein